MIAANEKEYRKMLADRLEALADEVAEDCGWNPASGILVLLAECVERENEGEMGALVKPLAERMRANMKYVPATKQQIATTTVTDADGVVYHHVLECDTESGRIVKLAENEDGSVVWNPSMGRAGVEELTAPKPLDVEEKT